jgi:hypothetical protein
MIRQQTWREIIILLAAAGLRLWKSRMRFPSLALCAVHVRQFEGASPLSNLVEVKD